MENLVKIKQLVETYANENVKSKILNIIQEWDRVVYNLNEKPQIQTSQEVIIVNFLKWEGSAEWIVADIMITFRDSPAQRPSTSQNMIQKKSPWSEHIITNMKWDIISWNPSWDETVDG